MLNEAPKKKKKHVDYFHPTPWQYFWRLQKEGWRRAVTPALMYFFMSLIMLACQAIEITWLRILLGALCIAGGIFFNAHLVFHFGSAHYDFYVTGEVYRRRESEEGFVDAPDHHVEKEYRPWKGFFIGFLLSIPVIILGVLAGVFDGRPGEGDVFWVFTMLAGCAIVPITWLRLIPSLANLSYYTSIFTILVPILVSGVFYILRAHNNLRKRREKERRDETVRKAAEAAREARLHHQQTEEQRLKTLQSKKKK